MKPLLPRLSAGEVLLSDGALGTQLMERGLGPGECPESWNLSRPEILEEVARRYVEAGAEFVTTNTFGASPLKLAMFDLEEKTEEINAVGVACARAAVGDRAYVTGSIGPTGRLMRPYGDIDPQMVYEGYLRQVRALVGAGVDAIFVETMTDLTEGQLAVRAAKSVAPGIPVAACMTFDRTPRGFFTIMGTGIPAAAAGLAEAGADVVGSNCGNGFEDMIEIVREFRRCTTLPLIAQANAGLPEEDGGRLVYTETPEFVAERAPRMAEAGVTILGGCCGTEPEHMAAMRHRLGDIPL